MGKFILALFVLLMVMCLCIYNWWDKREKSKRMFDEEKRKINPLNTHTAWGLYALLIFFVLLGIAGYEIYKLMFYIQNYQ